MSEQEIGASRILTPAGWVGPAVVEVSSGRITAVRPTTTEQPERMLVPGFVDIQVNGIEAEDVSVAADTAWDRLDAHLLAQGVTTWCPTLVTAPMDSYAPALARITAADSRTGLVRPAIAGAHLEGPFLGGAPGAHRRELLIPIDMDFLRGLPPIVRVMTLAPELRDAGEAIVCLGEHGVVPALGHSTASFAEVESAVAAGARLVTHLFNGMAPLHHREPGLAGAALVDGRLVASLIADGVHVHPAALLMAFKTKGAAGIALVTDAVAWASARLGRSTIEVRDGAPRLADGTLAGSALAMDQAIRNVVAAGVPLDAAITAASTTPAHLLGLFDRGLLAPGMRADLVALDGDLAVAGVWIGGDQGHH